MCFARGRADGRQELRGPARTEQDQIAEIQAHAELYRPKVDEGFVPDLRDLNTGSMQVGFDDTDIIPPGGEGGIPVLA